MRLFISFITFMMTLIVLVGVGGALWGLNEYRKPGPLTEVKFIIINSGSGLSNIAEQLSHEGAITSPFIFKASARLKKVHTKLKAGEYEIPPHASMARSGGSMLRS